MNDEVTKFKENKINLELQEIDARVIYHKYDGVELNTALICFDKKRKILSTKDGLKQVNFVANTVCSNGLANSTMTIKEHQKFLRRLPFN